MVSSHGQNRRATMGRPEYGRIQRQLRNIGKNVGQIVTVRRFVSGSAGAGAAGVSNEPQYNEWHVTGLMTFVTFDEVQVAGGNYIMGDVKATIIDYHPQPRDEIRYSGRIYRFESEPTVQMILGQTGWRVLLRRGDR